MPKAYTLSSLDAFTRYRALNIQAGTTFCDTAFEAEVASGRLSGGTLDKYACVALAGVVTEYLRFGQAEGGVGDVAQLDRLFSALQVCAGGRGGLLAFIVFLLQLACCGLCAVPRSRQQHALRTPAVHAKESRRPSALGGAQRRHAAATPRRPPRRAGGGDGGRRQRGALRQHH